MREIWLFCGSDAILEGDEVFIDNRPNMGEPIAPIRAWRTLHHNGYVADGQAKTTAVQGEPVLVIVHNWLDDVCREDQQAALLALSIQCLDS